jgi:hypothetical protein
MNAAVRGAPFSDPLDGIVGKDLEDFVLSDIQGRAVIVLS